MTGGTRSSVLALALALATAVAAEDRGLAVTPCAPAIGLERFVVDLGRLDPPFAAPVRAEVLVRNRSGASVAIERAVAHCGACTRVTGVPVRIEPGAEAEVGLVFEPGLARGRLRFGCTLLGSDGPWAIADVDLMVPGIDTGRLGSIDLGGIETGVVAERAFEVRSVGPSDARLSCHAVDGGLDVGVGPDGDAASAGGGMAVRRWLVRVRVPPTAGSGRGNGPHPVGNRSSPDRLGGIRLRLLDGQSVIEDRALEIRGHRLSPSSVRPRAMFLGCVDGLRSVDREVTLPPGAGDVRADGADVTGTVTGSRVRCALRIAIPAANHRGWRVVRGEVVVRRGSARWTVPWLGFAGIDGTVDAAPLPALHDLITVLGFKRDAILASTSSFRERTEIAPELVRSDDPVIAGQGLRIDRFVHRSHDGPLRVTAVRRLHGGGSDDEAVASDGSMELHRADDGSVVSHRCSDHGSHRDPAEWEAVGGLAGSVGRGTAAGPGGDLARELAEAGPARTTIRWDAAALPGIRAIRVDASGTSFGSVWLDPSRGLAPVLRDAAWTDGRVVDRSRWFAGHFFRTAEGIDMPAVVRVIQRRSLNPGAALGRMTWRTVFDQTLTCTRFTIDDPSPAWPGPVEDALSRAAVESERDWSSLEGG